MVAIAACTTAQPKLPMTAQLLPDRYVAADGKELSYTSWDPSGTVHAAIVAVHGLSGAASDFRTLGETLPDLGVAVYAPELRGQGNDPVVSERGDIRSKEVWHRDLIAFASLVSAKHPGVPVVWYGESMGALITLTAAVENPPDGLVLASPVIALREGGGLSGWKRFLLEVATKIVPWKRVDLAKLEDGPAANAQMTSDSSHTVQLEETPHGISVFTLRLLGQVGEMMDGSSDAARKIAEIPVLVLYSPNDPFTAAEDIETFFGELATPEKRKVRFDESYHLILHDVEKFRAVEEVRAFLDRVPR